MHVRNPFDEVTAWLKVIAERLGTSALDVGSGRFAGRAGGSVNLTPHATNASGEREIFQLEAPDERSRVLTVHFDVALSDPSVPALAHAVGVVQWGSGGHQMRAEVDVVNGTTISVAASFLRVSARVPSLATVENQGAVIVGAHCSVGARESATPATRQVRGSVSAGGESFPGAPPSFASLLTVLRSAADTTSMRVEFQDFAGVVVGSFAAAAGVNMEDVPVPAETFAVRIFSVAGAFNYTAIYTLAL